MSPAPDGWRDVTADMEPDIGIAMAASVTSPMAAALIAWRYVAAWLLEQGQGATD